MFYDVNVVNDCNCKINFTACGCSAFGSVREDCEQMTGRCVCKPGIQGQKCTVCSNHEHTLGPNGCFDRKYLARSRVKFHKDVTLFIE